MARCASCGKRNPRRARFCWACGEALGRQSTPQRELRTTVTIVFRDLTGSTALAERLDPESLQAVMTRYFERMRRVIERHGGTVEKFIGDAVMAVFGVPVAHEDDPVRAVRAAAEMEQALTALNREIEQRWGVTVRARTGVNTGEVMARVRAGADVVVSGDAVNVAARLEQAARPPCSLLLNYLKRQRPWSGALGTSHVEGSLSHGQQAWGLR